jgi:hypothetical protein
MEKKIQNEKVQMKCGKVFLMKNATMHFLFYLDKIISTEEQFAFTFML